MKNMIFAVATVALFAAPAMASKARVSALSSAAHLSDTSALTKKPHIAASGNFAAFEFGAVGTGAEGGFTKGDGGTAWGFYLGKSSPWDTRPTGFMSEENPFDLVYAAKGDVSWGVGLHYSASDKKATATTPKSALQHLAFSATNGTWDVYGNLGLGNTAEYSTTNKFTGSSGMLVHGGYWMDSMYLYADILTSAAKTEVSATETKYNKNNMAFGANNVSKIEGGEFFYGASYNSNSTKVDSGTAVKVESTYLGAIIGLETEAASWLVLRGSLTQDMLISTSLDETASTEKNSPRSDNTTVAAGAGIKWGKMMLDGTLAGATSGNVDGNNLLANASFTYKW